MIGATVRVCSAASLLALAVSLGAQSTTASVAPAVTRTGNGQIAGVVIDSLNGRYVSGAVLRIEPGSVVAATDSLGKFRVDRLAPGTYRVGVFHPLLETLGITLVTQPIRVGPDSVTVAMLAVPSATTLIRHWCRVQSGPYGESAVIGYVRDPETLAPVPGAEISIAWIEIDVTKESGFHRASSMLRDTTDATGRFRICGLPSSMQATLQARRGRVATPEIPISLGDRDVELLARTVFLPAVAATAKTGRASVSGLVMLDGAPPIGGSRVELVGTDIVAVTDEKGEFTLTNAPSGSGLLAVRHFGFEAQAVPVDLSAREETRVTITLPRFVPMMDPVLVTARRTAALDKVGFNERMKTHSGFFIGPERLEQMHPAVLSDILRLVPGLLVRYGIHGDIIANAHATSSGCVQYYMDESPYVEMKPGDVNRFVTAREIVAVEVYQPPETPPQYARLGGSCTTIVLWTRLKIRG
jgi:hypothetical protein